MFWELTALKIKLLFRQRFLTLSSVLALLLIFVSALFAMSSFVRPAQIYWDIALGGIFLFQVILALYLALKCLDEDVQSKMTYLLLSTQLSRGQWIGANLLALWLSLFLANLLWTVMSVLLGGLLLGSFQPPQNGVLLLVQTQLSLSVMVAVVLAMGALWSLLLRPLLALALNAGIVFLILSLDNIRRLFVIDQSSADFVSEGPLALFFVLSRILPPLNWLDLKTFVGAQPYLEWSALLVPLLVNSLWALLFFAFACLSFEKRDL